MLLEKFTQTLNAYFMRKLTTISHLIRSETENIGGKIRKMFYKLFDGMFDVNSL